MGQVIDAQYFHDAWSGSGVYSMNPAAKRIILQLARVPIALLLFWAWKVFIAPRRKRSIMHDT